MAAKYSASKASFIKRINDRQKQIGQKYGYGSQLYKDYHNTLVTVFGPENFTKSGNIKRGPETYDILDDKTMSALNKKQTAGQIWKAAERTAKEESILTGEHITADDIIKSYEDIHEIVSESSDDYYEETKFANAMKFYWESVGGKAPKGMPRNHRPSYKDIADIIKMQEDSKKGADSVIEDNPFDNLDMEVANIEDKLRKRLKARNERLEAGIIKSYFE